MLQVQLLPGEFFAAQKDNAIDIGVVDEKIDFNILFETNRAATAKAIHKAMHNKPGIDWLIENQGQITHCFHQMALDAK